MGELYRGLQNMWLGQTNIWQAIWEDYLWVHIWASCQIRKIGGYACAGNAGNVFPPPRIGDPNMQRFLWSRWQGKSSRHSRRMRNPQYYVSSKRPTYDWPLGTMATCQFTDDTEIASLVLWDSWDDGGRHLHNFNMPIRVSQQSYIICKDKDS